MSERNDDELVNVPVPRRYLMDGYQFLVAREQEAASSSAHKASSDNAGKDNRDQWWVIDDRIPRLKRAIKNETVLTLLNLTANHATSWVSFEQVYREARRSSDQARADLRGLSLLIKQLFPNNPGAWWPVDIKGGSPSQYRMSEKIALQWKRC
jgi:hypothetical protein